MLLMVEKGIRGEMRHEICHYAEAHKKYIKESSYLKYWDVNNLYGWAMSQKLPVNTFQLHEDFIKNYNQEIDEEYFLEVD